MNTLFTVDRKGALWSESGALSVAPNVSATLRDGANHSLESLKNWLVKWQKEEIMSLYKKERSDE